MALSDIDRRKLVHALALLAAAAGLPRTPAVAQDNKRVIEWKNWSGGQSCVPAARLAPKNLEELADVLRASPRPLRPVGAGHSFSALVPTDGTILSLDRLSGIVAHDEDSLEAEIMGGTRLGAIGDELDQRGQAFKIYPDINKQTLAGALSTATHGTGPEYGSMSTLVTALQIMTASGELIDCDAENNGDIFQAARVSLGALGVITKVRLQNQQPFRLKRRTWFQPFDEMLEAAPELAKTHRHFEFYYIPFSGMCMGISLDETTDDLKPPAIADDEGFASLKSAYDWLGWSPALRQFLLQTVISGIEEDVVVEDSWKLFPSERNDRFNEMEYHLPQDEALGVLRKIRQKIEESNIAVFFPIEFRWIQQDDIWLSPFYGRASCSIAIHRTYDQDYTAYFDAIEPLHWEQNGRPHWGKLHTLTSTELRPLYPQWDNFLDVRNELDPQGVFLNDHLKQVFGRA